MHTHIARRLVGAVLLAALAIPQAAWSAEAGSPSGKKEYTQAFMITAYYSPKPDQCCYVMGSYEADMVLNGRGTNGASGKEVYPGMAAAPSVYPFGTRISLPGIGVVTVEDRGGAIQTLESGEHRLDLWVGEGEEGLARALAFGVQRMTGTVYPVGTTQPADSLDLASLASPANMLKPYTAAAADLLAIEPKKNDRTYAARLLQEALRDAGYFDEEPTGFFGPRTEQRLRTFQREHGLIEEPADRLTRRTAAYLLASAQLKDHTELLPVNVGPESDPSLVRDAQRTLRFLGFYRGRTNGVYDENLRSAIFGFQKDQEILASSDQSGAGLVGPRTRSALVQRWRLRLVARRAEDLLLLAHVGDVIREKGYALQRYLGKGDHGDQVKALQRFLAQQGHLGADRVTGNFGAETERAVTAYQIAAGVIANATERGAGYVGPATRRQITADMRIALFRQVRAEGLEVL
ncbi:MAG: peptidoglycan-binding protein [Candidatus Peribacteraceae bacterium]|nr:peptidoglycan-binding protein [Candidatus Peribacteraceae bacterium]